VVDRECDTSKVKCNAIKPQCLVNDSTPEAVREHRVPMVEGECWSGCLAITECSDLIGGD
jgi:hypothetical protein